MPLSFLSNISILTYYSANLLALDHKEPKKLHYLLRVMPEFSMFGGKSLKSQRLRVGATRISRSTNTHRFSLIHKFCQTILKSRQYGTGSSKFYPTKVGYLSRSSRFQMTQKALQRNTFSRSKLFLNFSDLPGHL